jgi:pyruvate-formate lyase-activating enzyme
LPSRAPARLPGVAQHITAPVYGDGRSLPAHAAIEDARADFDSGLLLRVQAAMLNLRDGQILSIASPIETVADGLRSFEDATGHGLLSVVPDRTRPGWRFHYVRKGVPRTDWAARAANPEPISQDIADLMPRRLWLYTNYDCNLHCDYCCVAAGPRAEPRWLPADRIRALAGEAAVAGLERVFLTGGEPALRPDLPELIEFITDRLPLTLLTNAMLLRGPRWERLRPLVAAGRPVAFQVSLDSADPDLHDLHRGRGAHARALEGIRTLLAAGARVRLAASLPEEHLDQIPRLDELAGALGIVPEDRIFRPIALRGMAKAGEPIRLRDVAPELTCDAQGWLWHPLSNDPDMRLPVPPDASLEHALAAVRDRLEALVAERSIHLDRFTCG